MAAHELENDKASGGPGLSFDNGANRRRDMYTSLGEKTMETCPPIRVLFCMAGREGLASLLYVRCVKMRLML